MTGYVLEVEGAGAEAVLWADVKELENHAVPSAFGKLYEEACRALEEEA